MLGILVCSRESTRRERVYGWGTIGSWTLSHLPRPCHQGKAALLSAASELVWMPRGRPLLERTRSKRRFCDYLNVMEDFILLVLILNFQFAHEFAFFASSALVQRYGSASIPAGGGSASGEFGGA